MKKYDLKEYINRFILISIGYYAGVKFLTLNHWLYIGFIYVVVFIGVNNFYIPLKKYYDKLREIDNQQKHESN